MLAEAAPEIAAQRAYLQAENGIKGLEILGANDVERAVDLFRRDGFVVIADVLTADQTAFLAAGCNEVASEVLALDATRNGNRGSHRYSFGGSSLTRSQLHRPEWQMMLDIPLVDTLVTAIFGSPHFALRAASGDFCLPGATGYQPLHSDVSDWRGPGVSPFSSFHDPRGQLTIRDLPCPYVCVNFLPQDVTRLNGPTRQIPGTQHSRIPIPSLEDEPEWMRLSTVCPAPAGAIMVRDVRAWHGGTPNVSDAMRAIPNLEFYAPWFHEPMVPGIAYADYQRLSERARYLTRFCVADSGAELRTGATLWAP
ncbi:phytanoyl-CoA dioxygenase family protein [Sphingomonas sp. SUN039]|uniref:phytanoyl-CoA dioxygenase family protein n=1 Tax=Sphingomonas sp. SUN039 TaxID=2937787 RepID=UPI0021649F64|nr:phytanoyl-CoA dioxygenase family protein [Sphingomonas sp. SUN039]UVO55298.1 phytanoyl-CoA dioxygenase family protein [Sphingomonas sp. SUN039]